MLLRHPRDVASSVRDQWRLDESILPRLASAFRRSTRSGDPNGSLLVITPRRTPHCRPSPASKPAINPNPAQRRRGPVGSRGNAGERNACSTSGWDSALALSSRFGIAPVLRAPFPLSARRDASGGVASELLARAGVGCASVEEDVDVGASAGGIDSLRGDADVTRISAKGEEAGRPESSTIRASPMGRRSPRLQRIRPSPRRHASLSTRGIVISAHGCSWPCTLTS